MGDHLTNDDHATENDMRQAEVFDALGHPTRVVILKALSEGPAGFAELKKKLESKAVVIFCTT